MDLNIPFHVLEKTTKEFSDEQMIGSGGYGKVYKGFHNGEQIAIKLFYDVPALENRPFENEFFNILRIQHPNVVRLVGYCYETKHKHVVYNGNLRFSQYIYRILCFEMMEGGSLDKYLNESRDHDWPTCYNIIKGTCEGLNFLHGGGESQILHLDLKPANILLDRNMGAKVADFGLSRFFSKTKDTNTVAGTEDYMPPEYMFKKQISAKNDVYSLGVIIIEILAGRRGFSEFREMDDVTPFIELVITNWREWINATKSLCPSAELDQVVACIKIAIKCVDHERTNRPTVAEILDDLQETEKRFLEEWSNDMGFLVGQSLPTPTKSRLRGGRGGTVRDIKENPLHLTSLTIIHRGVIDAFSFSYIDQSGKKQRVGPWGTDYSDHKTETICFGPSEFVEEVSGAYGLHFGINLVISLTFVTNVRTYGPFGNPYHENVVRRTNFRFMADEGSSIIGFHGRSGRWIDAIGVYMYPSNRTTVRAEEVILFAQSLSTPTKSGPWGGSGGSDCDINEKPLRLTSLTVSYGEVTGAFSFSYIDQAGKKQSVGPWGEGDHSNITKTIRFGPSEYVKEISGAYGDHKGLIIMNSLTFVTNFRTYGPFGTHDHPVPDLSATHFSFMADEGTSIVGFYGGAGRYIDAIGVYTCKLQNWDA